MAGKNSFRNTFLSDAREAIHYPFFLAILGCTLCFCMDNWEDLIASIHSPNLYDEYSTTCVLYFVFNSFSFGGVFVRYLSCLLATLPFALNYSYEYQGEMAIYKIARCGMKSYSCSKILMASLTGGMTMMLGGLLFVLGISTYLPLVAPNKLIQFQGLPYFEALEIGNGALYFVIILYLCFLTGTLSGCIGMCVSSYIPNPYIAACTPMMARFLLVELGRLSRISNNLRLDMMLVARGIFYSEKITLLLLSCFVIIVICSCYKLFFHRIKGNVEEAGSC